MADLKPIVKESFMQYAGAVLQSRALVDVRDCLKPSARQIFYCMYTDKFVHSKPFKKTLKAIGSAMRVYIHGDSSCEGVIMRAGQPFAMRYPLIEVEGSYGNLMESGNYAAPRYTASRLSDISNYLFEDIAKDTINEWRNNYDDTEQYPAVLPSKGFYNIVNGTMGIGIGMSSSVPQFNLRELNEALIKLLWNPDCSFEDIYCAPDFATGGILLNEEEVKESLKNGNGKSCKLRSVISYDNKERCLIVTEIPYSVYTNTICGELEKILESEENLGIDRFNDLTGSTPLIKIYLSRRANPDKVLKYLYKNTSLQYYYGINMTMLENGRYPKIFTWKEALQSYLNHEMSVYRQGFIFDLNKIKNRIHIIEGLLKAISILDEVIALIKGAADTRSASLGLQKIFGFSEEQAKAILDIKLARLAKLEINKLEKEKNDLEKERDRIENILYNEELLKKEIEKGLIEVMNKFGDERRTKILNIEGEDDEPKEVKTINVNITNQNNIYISESSSLYTQSRGSVGHKIKLDKGEFIVNSLNAENIDNILLFTNFGNFFTIKVNDFPLEEKAYLGNYINLKEDEEVLTGLSLNKNKLKENLIFITKKGIVKKTSLEEYISRKQVGIKAIGLEEGDKLISVLLVNNEKLGLLTKEGNFLMFNPDEIRQTGRVTKGVKGIKLQEGDSVVSARLVDKTTREFASITKKGYTKRTNKEEFSYGSRYTKGKRIQNLKEEDDYLIDFLPIERDNKIMIVTSNTQLKIDVDSIPLIGKDTYGAKATKLSQNSRIVKLLKV